VGGDDERTTQDKEVEKEVVIKECNKPIHLLAQSCQALA